MASNLHKDLDNGQLHVPLNYSSSSPETTLKNTLIGTYSWDKTWFLSPILEFVTGASPPPTTVLNDRYVLTGALIHADWDGASQNDVVQYNGTIWVNMTALEGMVAVDLTTCDYNYFCSGNWSPVGGGGGGIITAFSNQANNRLVFCDSVSNTIQANSLMTDVGIGGLFLQTPLRVTGLGRFDGNVRIGGDCRVDGQFDGAIHDLGSTSGIVPINFTNGMAQKIELTGNTTIEDASEIIEGNAYRLIVYQDGVGGHTFTLDTNYTWTGGVSPAIPSGAGDGWLVDMLGISATEIMATMTRFQ